jgi:hypothetical protein
MVGVWFEFFLYTSPPFCENSLKFALVHVFSRSYYVADTGSHYQGDMARQTTRTYPIWIFLYFYRTHLSVISHLNLFLSLDPPRRGSAAADDMDCRHPTNSWPTSPRPPLSSVDVLPTAGHCTHPAHRQRWRYGRAPGWMSPQLPPPSPDIVPSSAVRRPCLHIDDVGGA